MENKFIESLRNREALNLFDSEKKYFYKIQINKTEKRVYWERYASKDKKNWVKWNDRLSLKDVCAIRATIWRKNLNQ